MGLDLFTGKKYEDIAGSNKDVLKPDITKEEFLVKKNKPIFFCIYFPLFIDIYKKLRPSVCFFVCLFLFAVN